MPVERNRIILVDTNCFLRLYVSPVLPLLGQTVGQYTLLTLPSLIAEFHKNSDLVCRYSPVTKSPKSEDLTGAAIQISGTSQGRISSETSVLVPYARSYLQDYCKKQGTAVSRNLSPRDVELLATAIVIRGAIATDEWPLRQVITHLMEEPADYDIKLFSSFDILHLLEVNDALSADARRNTIDFWVRNKEALHRGWKDDYQRLFNEPADEFGK